MMLVPFLAILTGTRLVSAFSDSSPLLAWSTKDLSLGDIPSFNYNHLFFKDELCDLDAIVFIDQPGLRAQDLRGVDKSSVLHSQIQKSSSSLQLPYVILGTQDSITDVAEQLSTKCGSRVVWGSEHDSSSSASDKHIFIVTLPSMYGVGSQRKDILSKSDAYLSELLNKIETTFSNTIVFYTGSVSRTLHERQELDEETKPFSFLAPQGDGILSRYQILTPGLIISLALGFFLLLPIVLLSINALASVQSSVRLDVPKPTGQDKKNQ